MISENSYHMASRAVLQCHQNIRCDNSPLVEAVGKMEVHVVIVIALLLHTANEDNSGEKLRIRCIGKSKQKGNKANKSEG